MKIPFNYCHLDYYVAVSQHEETPSFVEDDEAEQELQLALQRSRRTKEKKGHENDEADAALEKVCCNTECL